MLFTALGGLPIARLISSDTKSGIMHRQLLSGSRPAKVLFSKWLAGSLFLFVQFAVLAAAIMLATKSISYYAGSFVSLAACGLLLCLFAGALQLACGLFFKNSEVASFVIITALAALGGLFVPAVFMPRILASSFRLHAAFRCAYACVHRNVPHADSTGRRGSATAGSAFAVLVFVLCLRRMVRRRS